MNRRTMLTALAAGAAGLAGCSDSPPSEPRSTPTTTPSATESTTASPTPRPTDATGTPTPTPVTESLRVVALDAPTQVELGETAQFRFTVQNMGGEPRTFEPTVSARVGDADWIEHERWQPVELGPKESHTFESATISGSFRTSVEYRLDGFAETFSVAVVDRRLGMDQAFRDPLGRDVSVNGVGLRAAYTYTRSDGERRRVEAGDGQWWALATVQVRNRSGSPVESPPRDGFSLLDGTTVYPAVTIRGSNGYDPVRLARNGTVSGWIGYVVPEATTRDGLEVRWRQEVDGGDIGVVWR